MNDDTKFTLLAQMLPSMKAQYAEAAGKSRLKGNGVLPEPACAICGQKFSVKTQVALQTTKPIQYCPQCEAVLNDGGAAFVTIGEKKPRYWLGKGVKPEFRGLVVVVSAQQMDAILKVANSEPEKPYEKLADEQEYWFCQVHNRRATHILVRKGMEDKHVCDPDLAGIMFPCRCTLLPTPPQPLGNE